MFSPLFPEIATSPAKELRVIKIHPEGYEPLPEPFQNLSLRRKPQDEQSPYEIARHYSGQPTQSVFPAPLPSMRYKLMMADIEPTREISSIEAADAAVLNLSYLDEKPQIFEGNGRGSCCGDTNVAFAIVLNRAANLIASKARRGAGNMVFMHPDNVEILIRATTSAFGRSSEEETVGLWTKVGVINSSMVVYTNIDFTKDRAVVVYSGQLGDGPAQLVNRDGRTFLAMHENAADYVRPVLIKK